MSQQDDIEDQAARRTHRQEYTSKHPVPTIQKYKERRAHLKEDEEKEGEAQVAKEEAGESDLGEVGKGHDKSVNPQDENQLKSGNEPYPTTNRYVSQEGKPEAPGATPHGKGDDTRNAKDGDGGKDTEKTATEKVSSTVDPKKKRKLMKGRKRHGKGRIVTDPVTHLPITIHDMTKEVLRNAFENQPEPTSDDQRAWTGPKAASKSRSQLDQEEDEVQRVHEGMKSLFPPPNLTGLKQQLRNDVRRALAYGIGVISVLSFLSILLISVLQSETWVIPLSSWAALLVAAFGAVAVAYLVPNYFANKVDGLLDDRTWDAVKDKERDTDVSGEEMPESVDWMNSLLTSVWPLINPDLFASLVDTLEDVMQASLPKVIRMVSIDDLGQGSEAIRILGIRWLPTGAAGQSIDSEGHLKKGKENDRAAPGEGQIEDGEESDTNKAGNENESSSKGTSQDQQEQEAMREGMEAEEGDFINMELAFAYRARSSGSSIKHKAKNAHLYLKFYLPGGIAIPIWVELRGIVGIMRLRLQLAPDPPFFSLCTLTFLGQPQADLSCVPLSKHSLNIMNVPLISNFVQSSIDAALAEYVAPRSLTLDLKNMLVGDDFKKDTVARGVILVYIKKARGFKEGDGGFGPIDGSSDSYVTVSWGKFGKPVASTRVIVDEQRPNWNEWASVLVSPEEINADETLRLQLWDSDKYTADDDLGRVEVSLKELMHHSQTKNRMADREDGFHAEDPDETMPGTLSWSVGYFGKAHIQQSQLKKQTLDEDIHSVEELKEQASDASSRKLRESTSKNEQDEQSQETIRDFKEREDEMIITAPPPDGLPSGILSVQIHNITGLEVRRLNRRSDDHEEQLEDQVEQSDDLPDSYCTIMINHRKVYRTRTKPKNAMPFFNAGTERFVRDWRTTEVMISVRDSREGENDPLLGIIYLPLRRVFEKRSQIIETFPLAAGMGYGRARVSMVWRSVELKLNPEHLGWDYGTLEVKGPFRVRDHSGHDDLTSCKLKMKTKLGKAKVYPADGEWHPKKRDQESVFIPVVKRYASSLLVEFRKKSALGHSTAGLAVLWLSDIPDEEDTVVKLKVWGAGKEQHKRAIACADFSELGVGDDAIGEMEMTVRLWRGLSGFHKPYAKKARHRDVKDVMEVLDGVNDEKMASDEDGGSESDSDSGSATDSEPEPGAAGDGDGASLGSRSKSWSKEECEKRKMLRKTTMDSSSDEDADNAKEPKLKAMKKMPSRLKSKASALLDGPSGSEDDGSRGLLAQVQDYKRHHKQLHRSHRGVMQWKTARTLDWMVGKVGMSKEKLTGIFEHGKKDTGIETEV